MYQAMLNASTTSDPIDFQSAHINLLVVQSLHYVIEQFFLNATTSMVITISCYNPSVLNFYRLIMEDLFRDVNGISVQIVLIRNGNPDFVPGMRYFNLYLVDSLQAFLDIDPAKYTRDYHINEYHYVFLQQRDDLLPHDLRAVLHYCWKNQLINCNVQTQNADARILLYTYFPFRSGGRCGEAAPTVINEFVGARMLHATIFPKKLLHMHGCKVRAVALNNPPLMKVVTAPDGRLAVAGLEGRMLNELAQHLNFTLEVVDALKATVPPRGERVRIVQVIATAFRMVKERSVDIMLGYVRANPERLVIASALSGHYQLPQVVCVLRTSRPYTSLEILSFPYQTFVWMLILFMLSFGFFFLNVRYYATRRSTPQPAVARQQFNFIAIAIGLPTAYVPDDHNRRIIYMSWTLTSFVLRSVYTALLYDLFCSNLFRPVPNTLDDLIRHDFNIVMNRDVFSGVERDPQFAALISHMTLIHAIEEASAFKYLEQHPHEKLAAMGARDILLDYGRKNSKPGLFHVLPNAVMYQILVMYLCKHSFLLDQLDDVLQRMLSAGFMSRWVDAELDKPYFESRHLESTKFIGQNDLIGIYYIWGGLLIVALVVFLLEVLTVKWKAVARNPFKHEIAVTK